MWAPVTILRKPCPLCILRYRVRPVSYTHLDVYKRQVRKGIHGYGVNPRDHSLIGDTNIFNPLCRSCGVHDLSACLLYTSLHFSLPNYIFPNYNGVKHNPNSEGLIIALFPWKTIIDLSFLFCQMDHWYWQGAWKGILLKQRIPPPGGRGWELE